MNSSSIGKTIAIAHRGLQSWEGEAQHPENTLPAFRAAAERRIPMIEFDVQLSKDAIPVIIHDHTLDRTCEAKGFVSEFTSKELSEIAATRGWKNLNERDYRVPLLSELLDQLRPGEDVRTGLNIELKSPGTASSVCELIVEELKRGSWKIEDFLISSFHHDELLKVKEHNPDLRLGLLYSDIQSGAEDPLEKLKRDVEQVGAYSFNINCDFICDRSELFLSIRKALPSVKCFTYTPRLTHEIEKLLNLGVDGMFLDDPSLLEA